MTEPTIRIDEEFDALLRSLSDEESRKLEESILDEGIQDALKIWKETGILLDGHNRLRIARKHDLPFRTQEKSFSDREEAFNWILDNQLGRRNVTPNEASYYRGLKYRQEKKSVGNPQLGQNVPIGQDGSTRDRLAEEFGVNPKTVQRDEQFADAVDSVSRNTGADARDVLLDGRAKKKDVMKLAERSPEEQKAVVERVREKKKPERIDAELREVTKAEKKKQDEEKAAEVKQRTDRYTLHHRGIRELTADLDPDSVDVIITDPPYPREYLWTFGALAELGAKVLKPGGSILAMSGQTYLPDVIREMEAHLSYHWTIAYMTPGAHYQAHHRNVLCAWKPVLWFVKGEYAGSTRYDVAKSEARDKDHHEWGQSESGFADLIEQFTDPGEVVLDPFVGGGTTGVVAVRLNRLFIGADLEAEAIATASVRLAEEVQS